MPYFVYLLTNKTHTVLYTGVTRDLSKRVWQHQVDAGSKFTKKYKVHKLIYYELFEDSTNAISREKQIKGGSRKDKENLIQKLNPTWEDLSQKL